MRNSIVTALLSVVAFAIALFFNPALTKAMTMEEFDKLDTPTKVKVVGEYCGEDKKCTEHELAPVKLSYGMGARVDVDFNDTAPASAPATTPPSAPGSITDHGTSDKDGDGVLDEADNCLEVKNFGQQDKDRDGIGDLCDNCIDMGNTDQADRDHDEMGDVCDHCPDLNTSVQTDDCDPRNVAPLPMSAPGSDPDNDGLTNGDDCPNDPEDDDNFKDDDGCPDPDNDMDGILDVNDRCPNTAGSQTDGCPPASQQLLAAAPPAAPAPTSEATRTFNSEDEGRTFWSVWANNRKVPEKDRLRDAAQRAVETCPGGYVGVQAFVSGGKEEHSRNEEFGLNRVKSGARAVEEAGGHPYKDGFIHKGPAGKHGRGVRLFCTLAKAEGGDGRFNAGSGRPEQIPPTKACWDRNGDAKGDVMVITIGDQKVPQAGNEDNNLDGKVDEDDCKVDLCWDLNHNGGFDAFKDAKGLPMTQNGSVDEDWNQNGKFDGLAECKAPCWDKNQDHLFSSDEDINSSGKIEATQEGDCPVPPAPGTGPSGFHFGIGGFGIPSFYDGESAIGGLYLSLGWRIAALDGPMARLYGGVGGSDYSYGGMAGLSVGWDVTDWLDIGPGIGANASWLNDLSATPEYHFGLLGQIGFHYGLFRLALLPAYGIEVEKYEDNSEWRFRGAILGGVEF